MPIKAIIFDLEGVIIDTEHIWDDCAVEFLKRHGHTYDRGETKHLLMGRTIEQGAAIMRDQYGFTGDPKVLGQERREIFTELLELEVTFEPGFNDFFRNVVAPYRTAIATSMERAFFEHVDSRLHLTKLFGEHVYSIEDIGFIAKPHPDIFLYAAKKLGVDPANSLVIEDSPLGVQAAKAAGMYCVGITHSTTRERLNAANADQVVDRYDQIIFPL